MHDELAAKLAAAEILRSTIGDAEIDALKAKLYAEYSEPAPTFPISPSTPLISASTQSIEIKGGVGDHIKMITAGVYVEAPKNEAESKAQEALTRYLYKVAGLCSTLKLGTLDETDAVTKQGVQLANVYIGLHTTSQIDRDDQETAPLGALQAVQQSRYILLLGAPGYGKSTFVDYLTLSLARIALQKNPTAALKEWPAWQAGLVLPVRVILRDWVATLDLQNPPKASAALLRVFLEQQLTEWKCAEATPLLWQMIHDGRVAVLLDGFDEVIGTGLSLLTESIADLMRTCPTTRILLTCRELDYQQEPLRQVHGFQLHTVAALTNEQIDQFVHAWYLEYAQQRGQLLADADHHATRLTAAIDQRQELRDLARSPLLLTVMAIVHASRSILPNSRAQLYHECLHILLLRWRQPDPTTIDLLVRLNLPKVGSKELFNLLARLGFVAHERAHREQGSTGPADLSKSQVLDMLTEGLIPFVDSPERRDQAAITILYALSQGNGVLLQRGKDVYAFAHRTFQEFLAGYYIASLSNRKQLIRERASQIHWHKALHLLISFSVLELEQTEFAFDVTKELLQRDPQSQMLAGELLLSIKRETLDTYYASEPGTVSAHWEHTTSQMLNLSTTSDPVRLSAAQRVRAGIAHGNLCFGWSDSPKLLIPDQRLPLAYVGTPWQQEAWWKDSFNDYWCHCDAGPFWFGDERNGELKQVTLPYAFKIGRFPVTNAEYARFMDAGGYTTDRRWTPEGLGWCSLRQPTQPPGWYIPRFNQPTQPVVGVTWYEAMAYCAWVRETLGIPVRLPTSVEWERAARGTDQRRYPWGNVEPTPEHANYAVVEIGQPTPVGCFPQGRAACGAEDLSGNVMEWLATSQNDEAAFKPLLDFKLSDGIVVAFSGWGGSTTILHCGARCWFLPDYGSYSRGFRLVFPIARV